MRYLFIITCIACITAPLYAQNQKLIDSLEQKLSIVREDTNKVKLLNAIAFEYRLYNEAKSFGLLDHSVKLAKKLNFDEGLALAYNHYGILYKNRQNFDSSLYFHKKAFALWESVHSDEGMASSYNNQGRTYTEMGDYTNSMKCYLESLKLREKIKDTAGAAAAYNNIGRIYYNKRDFAKAKEYAQKSIDLRVQLGDSFEVARNLSALGFVHYELNEYDDALKCYERALNIFKTAGDKVECARLFSNIGNVLVETNKIDESIDYQLQALQIQKETGDSIGIFTSVLSLAQAYGFKGKYDEAAKYGKDALELLNVSGGEIKMYMDVYQVLGEIYRKKQDYKLAMDAYVQYNNFKDSLVKSENSRIVADMETKYQSGKKDLELKSAAYQLQKRKIVIGSLAVVILLIIVSGYLFYNRYKLRKEKELDAELIKQQELRNKAIIEAEERERVRIAKDLHDGIGQQLAAVKLNMNAMEGELAGNTVQQERLKALEHLVDETLKEVRAVSHNMMPNALIRKGLAAAVREFIDNIASTGLLKIDLQIVGLNERLDHTMETVLYRVMQETVSNIIKHAQASKISIQLIRHDDYLNFIIEDNGKGFDTAKLNDFSGIGLKNIISRIQYLNGAVDFDSSVGKGTTVIIEVPLA